MLVYKDDEKNIYETFNPSSVHKIPVREVQSVE